MREGEREKITGAEKKIYNIFHGGWSWHRTPHAVVVCHVMRSSQHMTGVTF